MLPLSADRSPATAAELAAALQRGFAERGVTPRSVEAQGGAFPQIERLTIDLTGARLTRDFRVAAAEKTAGTESLQVSRFELRGNPVFLESAPVEMHVNAVRAVLKFAGAPAADSLIFADAESGDVSGSVSRPALEALLHGAISEVAKKQGIEIKKTRLELTQRGPRALLFLVEATAKVFLMSPKLTVSGEAEIDDQLNARVSKLALGGDGMITKLAGGYLRPYLDRFEGRSVSLLAFTPGDLKLSEIALTTGEILEVRAKFSKAVAG